MIKKLKNMKESYGEEAKRYDYLNRIIASFAEIYHYDYSMSALVEEGKLFQKAEKMIRKDGIAGRIRAFYEHHLNESDLNTKMYYNESVLFDEQKQEFGFLTFGNFDESLMAEMISLAIRILEACGLKNVSLEINALSCKEKLFNYLDCLDIDYSEKNLSEDEDVSFRISSKYREQEEVIIQGGSYKELAEKISGLATNVFGFQGNLDFLLMATLDTLHIHEELLDVVLTYQSETEKEHALYLTQELRLNGFKAEFIPRQEKKFIQKNYNTKYVISLKEENILNDEVVLTDLYTNQKEIIKEMDLINHLDINF